MANLRPVAREDLPSELEGYFKRIEVAAGFVPNSLLTVAHRPEILRAFAPLVGVVLGPGEVDRGLKQLVALVASTASGCRYCQAHTASGALAAGVSSAKVGAVYEFETSALFNQAERTALRLARDAAIVPNATTPTHFDLLGRFFSESQVVELVAVISLFGWLNRWNDTVATQLEEEPLQHARPHLPPGWHPGKHTADSQAPGGL